MLFGKSLNTEQVTVEETVDVAGVDWNPEELVNSFIF